MRDFDLEAKDNFGRLYNYSVDSLFRELMLKDFSPFIDKGSKAKSLEIGSFDGSMTEQILSYVKDLTVVEPSASLARKLESRFKGRVKVLNSTIEDYATEEKFVNIFLVHTLEHVDDPVVVLGRIKNLLAPKGRVFIAVPNANALSRQIAVHMGLISHNSAVLESELQQGHLRTYSIDTLRRDILRANFSIEMLSGVFLKALANFQLDAAIRHKVIGQDYIEAANSLAKIFPDFSASLVAVCRPQLGK